VRTLVVTPTYLEAENITEFLTRLRAAVPDADVLVVDDNSPDGTGDLAEQAAEELGRIEVLHRPAKSGLGVAYRADMLRRVRYDTTRAVGYGFQIELAYRVSRAGGRIVEVPITFTDRVRGHSKMSPKIAAEELLLVTWWGIRDRVRPPRDEVPAPG
jgi:glycosyltransferase involved in cell wall biosynthesis